MSKAQREAVHQLVRETPLDFTADLTDTRVLFGQLQTATPLSCDVQLTESTLGDIPVVEIDIAGIDTGDVVLYFHGGGYAVGSASGGAGLASDIARRAHARAIAVEYRLAPEHPHPAATDDALAAYRALLDSGVPPERIAFAGESAGGGLVLATLLNAKRAGLPQPRAAIVMSPWVDLTNTRASRATRAAADPALTPRDLEACAAYYAGTADPADPLVSPLFGDLEGLPPLLIQVGSDEILLDDAIDFAARAASSDVSVQLDVTPEVPHVFQGMAAILDEAVQALDRAGAFLRSQFGVEEHGTERSGQRPTQRELADHTDLEALYTSKLARTLDAGGLLRHDRDTADPRAILHGVTGGAAEPGVSFGAV
ncbi:alpha/beta hydrolase [Nocardia sp. NPDC101769]|uniref:alpha/beta hydrolase n=1 Tax=Nocardia sp. NPDC101769 TaxID=3364333 RepID=UPI0037FA744E